MPSPLAQVTRRVIASSIDGGPKRGNLIGPVSEPHWVELVGIALIAELGSEIRSQPIGIVPLSGSTDRITLANRCDSTSRGKGVELEMKTNREGVCQTRPADRYRVERTGISSASGLAEIARHRTALDAKPLPPKE